MTQRWGPRVTLSKWQHTKRTAWPTHKLTKTHTQANFSSLLGQWVSEKIYSCIHFFQDPVSDLGWRYLLVEGQKWNFRLVKMFWSCHIQTLKFAREWRYCSALSHFCQNNDRNFFKIVQFLQCNSSQQSFVIKSDQLGTCEQIPVFVFKINVKRHKEWNGMRDYLRPLPATQQ